MSGIKIELEGYEDLIKALDRIDIALSEKLARDMVKAAAMIVADEARNRIRDGEANHHPELPPLSANIGIETKTYLSSRGARTLAIVGPIYSPTGGGGNHGHLLEFGHDIVARGEGKVRGASRRSGAKKKGGVTSGRVRPYPFLRPAFDSTKGQQLAAMQSKMDQAIRELNG